MNLPVQDPFWMATAAFIRDAIGTDAPFIGPREFRPVLPKVLSNDWAHAIESLDHYAGVAVHKGLMHELPLPVLHAMKEKWKCVFGNEVFLFFMPRTSSLPSIGETHLRFFYDHLRALDKLALDKELQLHQYTSCLVVASHPPECLDKTLRSLSTGHSPVLVVAATRDVGWLEAYCAICSSHRAVLEEESKCITDAEALKMGVRRLLEDNEISWIATFDDSMVVRPDFLLVMENFRNAKTQPVLGGLWDRRQGIRRSIARDGFQLVFPCRHHPIHLYAHRDYWAQRFQDRSFSIRKTFSFGRQSTDEWVVCDLVTLQLTGDEIM